MKAEEQSDLTEEPIISKYFCFFPKSMQPSKDETLSSLPTRGSGSLPPLGVLLLISTLVTGFFRPHWRQRPALCYCSSEGLECLTCGIHTSVVLPVWSGPSSPGAWQPWQSHLQDRWGGGREGGPPPRGSQGVVVVVGVDDVLCREGIQRAACAGLR